MARVLFMVTLAVCFKVAHSEIPQELMNGKVSQDFFPSQTSFILALSFIPSQLSCNRIRSLINQLKQSRGR
jgi:hypothetical protein